LRTLAVIGTSLIVVGLVMALVERLARHERAMESLTLRDALIIGLGKPGPGACVSRSGITLAVGMAIGLRRDAAARFSFCCRFRRWLLRLSSSFPSCCTITTWDLGPAHWPGRCWRVRISVHSMALALPPNTNHVLLRHLPSRAWLSLLAAVLAGSWREAPSVPLRRPPCGGLPTHLPARFARPSRPRLLRLSPQGQTPTWTGQVGIRYSSCSC